MSQRFLAWLREGLRGLAPSARAEDFRRIALVYFFTTMAIWFLAYGASTVFIENKVATWHHTRTRPFDVWARWDSGPYVDLARWGYKRREGYSDFVAWFPLYSYLIRILSPSPRYHYPMGEMISLVSFLLLLCIVFDLVAQEKGKDVAHLTVLYLSIFPSALYFRVVYAEALFTLLILLSYRGYLRENYLRCGIYGALAATTRWPGIALLPAFGATAIWEVLRGRKKFRPAMLFIGLVAVGPAVVMGIQWREVGDPLAFLHAVSRPDFQRAVSFPGASVVADVKRMLAEWSFRHGAIEFNLILDDLVAVLAVAGAIYFFRRYGFLQGIFALGLLLPPLMSGRTIGMMRYVLPIFLYVVFLAEIGQRRPWFHNLWIFCSSLFLAYYTICFACWYWTT